jgi:rRNA maturation protein Nop10
MNRLKKCQKCKEYTLKEEHCNQATKEAGYKYIKLRNAKIMSSED